MIKNYTALKNALLIASCYHGSGIDADWHINQNRNNILLSNSLHLMDEWGGYDGWADFTIRLSKKTGEVVSWSFCNMKPGFYRKYNWAYRDYFNDLFFDSSVWNQIHKYKTPFT